MTNKLPIDQIAKIADDVRLIQNFAENHNFDSSFLTAEIVPSETKRNAKKSIDYPLYSMGFCMFLVLVCIAVIKFYTPPLSTEMNSFVFLIGLLFTIIATMSAQMRFKENTITIIVAVGLLMLLFIGAGIFTPEQALDRASSIKS
jgi:hypothetical protein